MSGAGVAAREKIAQSSRKQMIGSPMYRFRPSDLTRLIKAAEKAGLTVVASEIGADGTIRLKHLADQSVGAFDSWKVGRHARSS